MFDKVYNNLQNKGYLKPGDKVLIAISGGVDSMNLLHFLHVYKEKLGVELGLVHVNHKQRQQSEQEEAYLRQWAQEQGYPIYVGEFSGIFSEQAARQFRYDFFRSIMEREGYSVLMTAHHADDQTETILMRLIRGSRLRHLSSIKECQGFGPGILVRPFLQFRKSDLPEIFHFEDESNESDHYFRNRVRHHLLPQLEAENPQFRVHLQSLANEVRQYRQAFTSLLQDLDMNDLKTFQSQNSAVQAVFLQDYLEEFPDLQLSKGQFEQVLSALNSQRQYQLSLKNGYTLVKTYNRFAIEKMGPETDSQERSVVLNYGNQLKYENYQFTFSEKIENQTIYLSSRRPITLRKRRDGDRIQLGNFHKKLSRLFIDDKISLEARERAIIGEQEGQIIFVQVNDRTYLRKLSENDIIKASLQIEKQEQDDKDVRTRY